MNKNVYVLNSYIFCILFVSSILILTFAVISGYSPYIVTVTVL